MSQHASLRVDSVGTKHRNVLKRFERIKKLEEIDKWQGRASVFGLPKVKSMKIKVKKTKEVLGEEGAAAGAPAVGGAAPAGAAAKGVKPAAAAAGAPVAKGAPAAKGAVAKPADKGKK